MENFKFTLKSKTKKFSSTISSNASIEEYINIFNASLVALAYPQEVIIKGIAQFTDAYICDYEYGYAEVPLTIGDEENIIMSISNDKAKISTELPWDATIIDLLNSFASLLLSIKFTYTTIHNSFINYVNNFSDEYNLKLWNKNEEETEEETVEDIMILEEEKENINKKIIEDNKATKDPFIQNLIESIKNA